MRNRRNRLREDELWDELKYWLENPVTDVEESIRQQEEQNYVNAVLDKAFGEEAPKLTEKEPYLTYEDLLNEDEVISDGDTATIAPLEGKVTKSYPTDPYMEIDERDDLTEEEKVAKKEEIAQIQANAAAKNREIDIDNTIKQGKLWGGALLQIASAATPYGKIAPAAKVSTAIAKKLAPKVGRKIANEIATGTVEGTMSGAVEGLGRGMVEDENSLKTAAQDAAAGLVLGSAGGATAGNIEKYVRGKLLKNYGDIDKLDKVLRKQYSKNSRNYYQDYNQGRVVDKNGPIEFTNRGQREVLRWNPKQAQHFPELINDIKNAEQLPNISNTDPEKIYTSHFEVYRGKNGDHLVDVNKNGKRRYYTTKDTLEGNLRAPSTGTFKSDSNIIPPTTQTLNPNLENISKKPSSFDEWLEELKRKRKFRGR